MSYCAPHNKAGLSMRRYNVSFIFILPIILSSSTVHASIGGTTDNGFDPFTSRGLEGTTFLILDGNGKYSELGKVAKIDNTSLPTQIEVLDVDAFDRERSVMAIPKTEFCIIKK